MMDLTTVFDSYLVVIGEPIFAGIILTLVISGLMIRLGASFDQILIIAVPFMAAMILGSSTLLPKSTLFVLAIVIGVIIAIALGQLTRK